MKFCKKKRIALVRITGVIHARGRGLSIENIKPLLQAAFRKRFSAVAVIVNSPGGAPVQTDLIAREIRRLSEEQKIPVYTFCEDIAASGGYWILCSGDEVYAMPGSILGSIGVLFSGFGFVEILKKLGIERRIYTAGEHKAQLDPFLPTREEDIDHLKEIQHILHTQFISYIKQRRGNKLQDQDFLFSGNFWLAPQALNFGLIDAIGDPESVLKEKFGTDIKIHEIKPPKNWIKSKLGLLNSWLYSELFWKYIGL